MGKKNVWLNLWCIELALSHKTFVKPGYILFKVYLANQPRRLPDPFHIFLNKCFFVTLCIKNHFPFFGENKKLDVTLHFFKSAFSFLFFAFFLWVV